VEERFFSANRGNTRRVGDVSIPEEYLLIVGSIEPRKNHISVLRAIDQIPDCPTLVIAGGRGWADEEIMRAIHNAARSGKAVGLGHVPDEDLPQLYAGAAAVISASWYEGFGLPVLEGLAAGTRVVASDIPAHREVAGPHAIFVDPGSVDSIADGIIRAITMGQLTEVEKSAQQQWARTYNWERSAERVYRTLQELL
jgi:glycosyltransferase involved in cell wall biosynthesis